jgi:hypothetical protein
MSIHRAQRCIPAMHDEVDSLFAEAPLQPGMEPELTVEQLRRRPIRFDVQVDVAASSVVVNPRAEQAHARLRTKSTLDLFADDADFVGA